MSTAPAVTEISDTYPNPSNAVARAGFASLHQWILDALGTDTSAAPVSVASSATVDLSAVTTTRHIVITGTTQITAFTVPIGRVFYAKAAAALPIANNANIVTQTGANITLTANEGFLIRATAANTVEVIRMSFGQTLAVPTYTLITSGSGTYTTPSGAKQLVVKYVGAGGGGAGGGSTGSTAGAVGGDTTFNSIVAKGGGNGGQAGGGGGAGGEGGSGTATARFRGNAGVSGVPGVLVVATTTGGIGGGSAFFGGGSTSGVAGAANSGGGGGGGACNGTSNAPTGGGGGGGESVLLVIDNPSSSYSYAVGSGGAAGNTGTNGFAGAAGGSGFILVEERY